MLIFCSYTLEWMKSLKQFVHESLKEREKKVGCDMGSRASQWSGVLLKRAKGIFAWWNKSNDCLESFFLFFFFFIRCVVDPMLLYSMLLLCLPALYYGGFSPFDTFWVFWKEKRWLQNYGYLQRAKGYTNIMWPFQIPL